MILNLHKINIFFNNWFCNNKIARPKMFESIKILMEKEKQYQVHPGYDIRELLLYNDNEEESHFGDAYYMPRSTFLKQKISLLFNTGRGLHQM